MDNWKPIEEYLRENILIYANADEDLIKKYTVGTLSNLLNFIYDKNPKAIMAKNDKIFLNAGELENSFGKEYLHKKDCDYSAEDFALSALRHVGMPPIEAMSVESIKKKVYEIFDNKYKDQVYLRCTQGGYLVGCLSREYEMDIPLGASVSSRIDKQKKKAERKRKDTDEWQEYDEEKARIAYTDYIVDNGIIEVFEEPEDETTKIAHALLSNDDFINKIADLVANKIIENEKEES